MVFEAKNTKENFTVRNESDQPILVQSWLDGGTGDNKVVPFAVTSPLTKLGAKGQQILGLLFKGNGLPLDKEAVVWLNVQEITPKSNASVSISLRNHWRRDRQDQELAPAQDVLSAAIRCFRIMST